MTSDAPTEPKRGLGPFTSRQLTTIVCIAIVSIVVIIPTAALAASGTFTSATSAPAVLGSNSSLSTGAKGVQGVASNTGTGTRYGVHGSAYGSGGIGVGGAGASFGVYSYGNLGVKAGNSLVCVACVPKGAIGAGIFKNYQVVTKVQVEAADLAFFGGISVACPTGKKVLGGGGSATTLDGGTSGGYNVPQSYPDGDTGWIAVFNLSNPGAPSMRLTVYAICATVS
ncbi:MAG TPA: hypothetical protein VGP92_12935 [Acidimicrobiia bacterium]|nr:hypothetical protein [Acidimicrobiia bacterium]